MNLRTTLVLILLTVAGGVTWTVAVRSPREDAASTSDGGTLDVFRDTLKGEDITRVAVRRTGQPDLVFLRGDSGAWVLPGGWPTRETEVNALIDRLGSLQSRFEPIALDAKDKAELKKYGLSPPAAVVEVRAGKKDVKYTLEVGEGEAEENSFFKPTYVRLDERPEVVRLGPGLVAMLSRPREFYQKRRLFPYVREERGPGSLDRVDRLNARSVTVERKGATSFTLSRAGNEWKLTAPTVDRLDEGRRNALLEAVGELRAERFVSVSPSDVMAVVGAPAAGETGLAAGLATLAWARAASSHDWLRARAGLDKPERALRVATANGVITLQIGNVSSTRARSRPPGMPPDVADSGDELRFARLEAKEISEELIFEIKGDKLRDVFVTPASMRDTRLARFENKNVRKVEITQDGQKLTLARDDKDRWKVEIPSEKSSVLAEEKKVDALLNGISGWSAQDKEGEDPAIAAGLIGLMSAAGGPLVSLYPGRLRGDTAAVFAHPLATIRLTIVEEEDKGAEKQKKSRTTTLVVGGRDEANKQLWVRVDDWPRVELVSAEEWNTVKRPALAYRGKLLDLAVSEVQRVTIEQEGTKLDFARADNRWRMTAPAATDADPGKVGQLLTQLGSLEPIEYVTESPSPSDLETRYGLAKPALAVTVGLKEKSLTLKVGNKREGKNEYYAALASGPSVFVVGVDVHDSLKAGALTYLPTQLWRLEAKDVQALRIEKAGAEPFELEQAGDRWKVGKPYDTGASESAVKEVLDVASNPHCDRYEALGVSDPAKYGFDKPFLRLKLTPKKDAGPARDLIVGATTGKDTSDRYARTADGAGVCVIRGDVVKSLDRSPLDLVDTLLLNVPPDGLARLDSQSGGTKFALQPGDKEWKLIEGPGAPFAADENAVASLRGLLFNLRAERYAAYGSSVDPKKYGLETPAAMLTLAMKAGDAKQTLLVGAEVADKPGQRYARLERSSGVAVLTVEQTRVLTRTHLDYVDHRMFHFPAEKVTGVQRAKGQESLEIAKQDDEWQILKPQALRADDKVLEQLLRQLGDLRAAAVAEFPLKNPEKYGLDKPTATLTLKLTGADGKPAQHVLTLGGDAKDGQRYAKVDTTQTIFVLSAPIVRAVDAPVLSFRTRAIARFTDADKILLERGQRQATFARVGATWSMTMPLEAKIDADAMDEFLNTAARLEADDLVAEKPADLKPYGLDRPAVRWRFQSDGKDVLDLHVGSADAKGRRYARLGSDGLVFLLKPDLSKTVLREFRETTVWTTPFDAASADTLRLTRGDRTVTLKKGVLWMVEGKPDVKVELDTVNDTVAALAGLKLDHYAVDKGADKKLFGLDPPELIIEADAGEKKITLHIGRFEGDSKRAYACLPDKGRSDVFVLSAADTARLTRTVEDLGKPLPKKPPMPESKPLP